MSVAVEAPTRSFVLLPLGGRRVAFAADSVVELTAPERLQNFPHRTSWISGVLVRRNRVVPVCDISELFREKSSPINRFYVIVEWQERALKDWCAIPVAGECELASAESLQPPNDETSACFPFVIGSIPVNGEEIAVVDLAKLIQALRGMIANSAEDSGQ